MKFQIYFDGSFSQENQVGGAGVVVVLDGNKLYDIAVNVGKKADCFMTELSALSIAVDEAAKLRMKYPHAEVVIMGDNKGVISKVNSILYGADGAYASVIAKLLSIGQDNFSLKWIGREGNMADRCSKIGRVRKSSRPSVFYAATEAA